MLSKDIETLQEENKTLLAEKLELKSKLDDLLPKQISSEGKGEDSFDGLPQSGARVTESIATNKALYEDIKQRVTQSQMLVNESKFQKASKFEIEGFKNLMDENFSASLENFEEAYRIYPEYHNVQEIYNLLRSSINELQDPSSRDQKKMNVYRDVVEKYSWGIPNNIKEAMQKILILNDSDYLVSLFKSPESKTISDKIVSLNNNNLNAVTDRLTHSILPPSNHWAKQVNLYISRTLALMEPNWYGTREQYNKVFNLIQSRNYGDKNFKKWVDQAINNHRVVEIQLETIRLKKAGDIFSKGGDIFFGVKFNSEPFTDLEGFPTEDENLKLSSNVTHRLKNLFIRTPQFKDQDFWPLKLTIHVWDHDPSKSENELVALFALNIDENRIGKRSTINSIDQEDKFPKENGQLTLYFGSE